MSDPRITFGFARTECACDECVLNCHFIPGYLIPTDLDAIAAHLGDESVLSFALENLLASPGATVMANGQVFQIPTLVPARQANGACKFLTKDNHCAIQAVSPFGCSHFDVHQSKTEADERSLNGLQVIAHEWETGGLYAQVWTILHAMKQVALPAIAARSRLHRFLFSATPERKEAG